MKRFLFWALTHLAAVAVGFGLGVYFLPILTAPAAPDQAVLQQSGQGALFQGNFTRDLPGSDFLHWGEGEVSITEAQIVHMGKLAPGPDYKLYLVPEFVTHEDAFLPLKSQSVQVGDIKTFEGFILDLPEGIDPAEFTTVLIWCEAFGEFITAAKYR